MSPAFPGAYLLPPLDFFPRHLEVPSFDTTVRRRPDRSRPPQVGAAAHTCPESAARAEPARTSRASCLLPFRTSVRLRQRALPAHSRPAERRSLRRNQGGAGGIISPACLFCLSCLSGTEPGAYPKSRWVPLARISSISLSEKRVLRWRASISSWGSMMG